MQYSIYRTFFFFFRSLFIVGGYGSKQFTFNSQDELDKLMRKATIDVSSTIRQINPSRVIFALDSRSWRKDISIDENEGYKGQRQKSKNINWDNIYAIMKEFGEILETNGFIVSQVEGAEADDLMALWKKQILQKENQHAILVSGDEDIRQLASIYKSTLEGKEKSSFCVIYNPFTMGKNATKKLFAPSEFSNWVRDEDIGDIFNRSVNPDKEDFCRIIDFQATKLEIIDGPEIALRKIFCGDDGDNIPAIYTWLEKDKNDSDKEVRITPSKYEKIIEAINTKIKVKSYSDLTKKDSLDIIESKLIEFSKGPLPFKVKDRLKRQIDLVVLEESIFPKEVVNGFYKELEENLAKPQIHPQSFNLNSILGGTRYVSADGKSASNESSIFDQIDRISNKALF